MLSTTLYSQRVANSRKNNTRGKYQPPYVYVIMSCGSRKHDTDRSCSAVAFELAVKPRPVTQHSTSKSRRKTYENLVDVGVRGNFSVNFGLTVLCTGYGRRRLFHC